MIDIIENKTVIIRVRVVLKSENFYMECLYGCVVDRRLENTKILSSGLKHILGFAIICE